MKVKIFGAGSIGNHLANASRRLLWEVDVFDIDNKALFRMKEEIYPSRYGKWDQSINLLEENISKKVYDLIIVGTPPDTHIKVACSAIDEKPRAILIEKPLTKPDLLGIEDLVQKANHNNVRLFIGYDHVLGKAAEHLSSLINEKSFGKVKTIDVNFREYWGGIFAAHPWLAGPSDSYLGFWDRGGGACGEHSHGINLWQYISHLSGNGRIEFVSSFIDYEKNNKTNYDSIALLNVKTENGLIGRIVQDVVTNPPIKSAHLICENGSLNWTSSVKKGQDSVETLTNDGFLDETKFIKNRPEDFILELSHIEKVLRLNISSPIDIERGIETMLVISAAHLSAKEKKVVKICYEKGNNLNALECL